MSNSNTNFGMKAVCAVLLVVIGVAAGVVLLAQHRKLDELWRARADLARANEALAGERGELMSANGKLADEIRKLREIGRTRTVERKVLEGERAAWAKERTALKGAADAARVAQSRAEKEVLALKRSVMDLTALERKYRRDRDKMRVQRDKMRAERDRLERELNGAMESVPETEDRAEPSVSDADAVIVAPAPPPDTRTPAQRAAHGKEELRELIGL